MTSITTNGSPRSLSPTSRTNRLSNASYDAAGNMLSRGSGASRQQYTFDPFNMLRTVQSPAQARGHVYTVEDERLVEFDFAKSPWEETWAVRDLDGRVLRQWQNAGGEWTWLKDYVYRGSRLLASETSEGTQHFHLDHLGSPRLITAAPGGGEVARSTYFPYGEEATNSSQSQERMRFTGHERDLGGPGTEDDLDYMHARYCVPSLGRFLTTDPARTGQVSSSQSWNRYTYARGNPIKFVDPDGAETRTAIQFEVDLKEVTKGRMTSQEFQKRTRVRGQAAVAVGSLFVPGPEDIAVGTALATKFGQKVASRFSGFLRRLFKGSKTPPLHEVAEEIRTAGHPIAANRRTIAVGEDAQGGLHVGSSNGFDAGQREAVQRIGANQVPSHPGLHAEEELLMGVDDLRAVGTSKRLPCGPNEHNCAAQLAQRGVTVTNPGS